jgi:hypothetical protein
VIRSLNTRNKAASPVVAQAGNNNTDLLISSRTNGANEPIAGPAFVTVNQLSPTKVKDKTACISIAAIHIETWRVRWSSSNIP